MARIVYPARSRHTQPGHAKPKPGHAKTQARPRQTQARPRQNQARPRQTQARPRQTQAQVMLAVVQWPPAGQIFGKWTLEKTRAEKPCKTPPPELKTEPYGASYDQKPSECGPQNGGVTRPASENCVGGGVPPHAPSLSLRKLRGGEVPPTQGWGSIRGLYACGGP